MKESKASKSTKSPANNPWADRLNKKLAADKARSQSGVNNAFQANILDRFQNNTPSNTSRKAKKGFRAK